ncbi:MAG: alpha/beta hydrolase-fold protein, partial [Planctomycetota bacterium]|nr:alpha/beta hydrolase-fold protein [Planctomycetota bacterium]
MKRTRWSMVAVVVAMSAASAPGAEPVPATAPAEAPTVKVESRVFSSTAEAGQSLPYLLFKPVNWDAKKQYPLLVFLHGEDERGTDNQSQVKWGAAWLERAVRVYGAVVIAPQCPKDCRWVEVDMGLPSHDMPKEMSKPMRLLFELLPGVEKEFSVDPARRYIAGYSMGGFGVWDALCRRPDYFAAALPICGGADGNQAPAIAKIPVWAYHGAIDTVVPPARSRNIVAALTKAGGKPKHS